MKKVKKFILCLVLILISITKVNAKTPTICNREELDNNGVNKHWNITSKNISNVKKTPCVDASEKIYDFQGVLTEEEYGYLKKQIDEYIEKNNMDLVIVIDSIPYTNDKTNEDYAADFYDYNDFGIDFEKYSGTLLLRNTYEKDPYYDMYAFGEAQLIYDYDIMQIILDGIYDDLHSGNYYSGFSKYISYLGRYYSKDRNNNYSVDKDGYIHQKYHYPGLTIFIISSITTLVIILIFIKKNKMVMKATKAEQYLDRTNIRLTNRQDEFIGTHTTSYTVSSDSGGGSSHSSGGGSFHSSSGSSGGGHSSGGGRHG